MEESLVINPKKDKGLASGGFIEILLAGYSNSGGVPIPPISAFALQDSDGEYLLDSDGEQLLDSQG